MNPKLIINLFKLRTNLDRLVYRCHAIGIKTAIVTKVFCADERICKMISESDADAFADSRVQNLAAIAELHSDKPTQLLRISMQSEVEDVVRYADISMQSEKETIRLIGSAAKKLGKVHKIILMVDMGDLREGIFNTDEAIELASPMSEERRYIRTSILPSLLDVVSYNRARNIKDINVF